MIQIETLRIESFRGIRQLTLNFDRKNFGIYGPNGTGKSGIVDAIEFALTGSVTRLTGKGTSGVSVKDHAPHVDLRNQPTKAAVSIIVFAPSLSKTFTIERRVATASKPMVTPADDPTINELVATLAEHPEFALSRREILKYVITQAGERAKEVQALLKLDDVERMRTSLQSAANECKRRLVAIEQQVAGARSQLLSALKIEELSTARMLAAVNERRKILGLEPLAEFGKDTSLKSGIGGGGASGRPTARVKKTTAAADLAQFDVAISENDGEPVRNSVGETTAALTSLRDDPSLLKHLLRRDFFVRGLELLDDPACPLCDTRWEVDDLRTLIQEKVRTAAEAAALKTKLQAASRSLQLRISELSGLIGAVQRHLEALGLQDCSAILKTWDADLATFRSALTTGERLDETIDRLNDGWRRAPSELAPSLEQLRTAIAALPDPSVEEEARDYLTVCEERLDAWRRTRRQFELWKARADRASTVSAAFEESSKAVLTGLYREVESDFSRYYAFLNHDDESQFLGRLTPSLGKLGFDVDFHGRGMFPPGAYHSEGHQDSMGLCLYLALMKRVLGDQFRLAVLDDVLMSVDSGHRKEVCRLFKTEFPNTQFIFTTHDQVWLNHMVSEGLVAPRSTLEFRRWTVDDGPHVWDLGDVWADIQTHLNENDVPGAAQTLRRYLEKVSWDLATRLRAPVEGRAPASCHAVSLPTS